MALPQVNSDRVSEERRLIDSQTENRQRLQKSMREGQLNIVHALKDLNDGAERLEKIGKKKFGPQYRRNRYKLTDFFI